MQADDAHSTQNAPSAIRHGSQPPGSTIGMVGGGQLGRMFAVAAAAMGYRVIIFTESADSPAAQIAHETVVGDLHDQAAIDRFAQQCDVITLEFENIPAATIARCREFAPTYPSASVLAITQNRLVEKSTLRDAGLPVTPFCDVDNTESLILAGHALGWPLIVKTARSGYDGKGQQRVESADGAGDVDWDAAAEWIAEKCISFDKEVSVIVARTPDGRCDSFPIFENSHHNHILDISIAPALLSETLSAQTREVAVQAAEALDVVGLLCVEFFVSDNEIMINEVAPRPHNSGHLTIEACETSQFEQHVRAVCNLPLGSTLQRTPFAAMANLLGDLWGSSDKAPDWAAALTDPGISLHLYGKSLAKPGRKMGHLTITGAERDDVAARVSGARSKLS
ncbi:MAG: 5-(carboxyamino)imidazole ribonucleotide synthase [Rubripirellula sp.]|nr:5-(carboxyamino)imidazole ribonucleotide synthase [Rubripirellula sp.]